MSEFYYKDEKGKYHKRHETPRFLSDGVWVVQTKPGVHSQQCIMKIGELSSVFPFADLAQHSDRLAEFIRLWNISINRYNPYGVHSLAILKFISMTEEEKKSWLKQLREETKDEISKYDGC
jgi:hypothetical protein